MDVLSLGDYTLNIKYYEINKSFSIFNVKKKDIWIATTHFQITGRLSPCQDQQESLLETTFNISIGCNQCTALSNMPMQNTEKNEHNILWTHFDTTPAISPYLATLIVSNDLLHIYNDTSNIQMWCRNESRFHLEFAKNLAENITLLFKNKWYQRSKNISNVTHVAIPNFHDNDITLFGLVIYKETDIISSKGLYPVAHDIEIAQLVGCKVAQEWFYDLMNNQSELWLNKGLITLIATYGVNKIYPDNRIINLFVVQNQHISFYLDGDFHTWNSTSSDDNLLTIRKFIRGIT
ncbi:aminopeptidase N-like isoform X1 [Nylanderia fulva]|uniref:aminopeptidase N-like isoform X1 n=2 Tax=Nylanderia fulva TaxID=613905 RepID=UPI0010FB7F91|nr:aminopeptidase N-like isoform X1 [Nylanderia fulva]